MNINRRLRVTKTARIREFTPDQNPETDEPSRIIAGKTHSYVFEPNLQQWRNEETGRFTKAPINNPIGKE